VVFGPSKLPEIGKAFGKTIREFKDHSNKVSEEPIMAASTEDDITKEA